MGRIRDPLLVAAATCLLVATAMGVLEASGWIGRTFPGFLMLGNRVVASAGLTRWPATRGGEIYQHEVVAVDGRGLRSVHDLHEYVSKLPRGTPVRYRLRRDGRDLERTIETRRFDGSDFTLLFGSYLVSGLGLGLVALAVRYLRPRDRAARGSAFSLWIMGMWAITAMDLYGPHRLFRVHAALECFLFAATLHLAFSFPYERRFVKRRPGLLGIPYGAAALLAAVQQAGLHDPGVYAATHLLAMKAVGLSIAALIACQVLAFVRPPDFRARQRVKVLVLGTLATFLPHVALLLLAVRSEGAASENLMGWSGIFFPLSIGYAVLRDDLLEVDAFLRRTVSYVLLTAIVALAYAAALAGFESLLIDHSSWGRGLLSLAFAMVSVTVLLPLRDRVQSTVDQLFFRSAYDFRRLVEKTSARLASATDLDVIATELERAVREALQPETIHLAIRRDSQGPWQPVGAGGGLPKAFAEAEELARRRLRPFDLCGGGLAMPFRIERRLIALLVLGRRGSGRPYGGDDRRLLLTLAHQGAVALDNALALERLRELNRDLERKVNERTAELAAALGELRDTQSQLVHQEKMASLGQLVAGVAHEINNPLNFIQGNLHMLRQYTYALVHTLSALDNVVEREAPGLRETLTRVREENDLDYVLEDLDAAFRSCEDGVKRTTTIVQDLRTFSRLDSSEASPVDLHEAIESTLTLLKSRLKGVEVLREYGKLPPVECLPGQMNQVWMNLLVNAADAVGERGTIIIRTRPRGEAVCVEVEDDGCGIPPDHLNRIFEPFFTTKEVGRGTGLGLSISYGIVARHGGAIRVRSEVGRGTRFSVELPLSFQGAVGTRPSCGSPGDASRRSG